MSTLQNQEYRSTVQVADGSDELAPMSRRLTQVKGDLLLAVLDRRMEWCDNRTNGVDDNGHFVVTNTDCVTGSELTIVTDGETFRHLGMTYVPGNGNTLAMEPEDHLQLFHSHTSPLE